MRWNVNNYLQNDSTFLHETSRLAHFSFFSKVEEEEKIVKTSIRRRV